MNCLVPTCEKQGNVRKYCLAHYRRWLKYGDPTYVPPLGFVLTQPPKTKYRSGSSSCSNSGCTEKVFVKSMCKRHYDKAGRFRRKYHLTPAEHGTLLATQDGMCAICKLRPATEIDHDHRCCPGEQTCGRCIRGILCRLCNLSINLIDNGHLENALAYLRRYESKRDETL